jgi:uncharacterized membrane protein YwzB
VVLISGDVNFSMELNDLMHLHSITVILVHNSFASEALKHFATQLVNYDEFIKDVNPPSQQQLVILGGTLAVTNDPLNQEMFNLWFESLVGLFYTMNYSHKKHIWLYYS